MTPNILIVNVHSWQNSGDGALLDVTLEQLRQHFPGSHITLAIYDPKSYQGNEETVVSFLNWLYQSPKKGIVRLARLIIGSLTPVVIYRLFHRTWFLLTPRDLRNTIEAYLSADLIVNPPGGYYHTYGRGRMIMILAYTMAVAVLAGKPLYLFPGSYGPFKFKRELRLTRWLFDRARVVMVREAASLEHLAHCGIQASHCIVLPDMAFAYEGEPPACAQEWLHAQGIDPLADRPLLGVTVINRAAQRMGFDQDRYEKALAAAIRFFVAQYAGKVLLLPQACGPSTADDDRIPSRSVVEKVSDLGKSVLMIDAPLPAGLIKAIYGQMDLLIGTRMHSNIFAMSQGVPVIAIGYVHKTRAISQGLGIEEWVIDIEQVDEAQLIEKLKLLWAERDQVRAHLETTIPGVIQQIQQVGEIVAEDFAHLKSGGKQYG
jgi:colanic acid/amylovoran biosynthesis protein